MFSPAASSDAGILICHGCHSGLFPAGPSISAATSRSYAALRVPLIVTSTSKFLPPTTQIPPTSIGSPPGYHDGTLIVAVPPAVAN